MAEKTQIVITAKDETGAAIASAKRGLDSLAAAGTGLQNKFAFLAGAGGLAGLIGGAGLSAVVKNTINDLDKLDESAERVGVSVEALSALNFAGKLSGLEFEDMTTALTKLSVKMQDAASGNKDAIALFADLGVKVTDASGKLKSADVVLEEVADAFAGFEDGAAKTAAAVDLFGKSGAKLVPLLNQGADGIGRMRKEAESLGAVISGDLAKQAAQFNDNLDRLTIASGAVGKAIAADLLPWLNKLSEEFLAGISSSGSFWAALEAGATLNPFKNTAENLKTVRADLEKMESDLKEYGYVDEQRYARKKNQLEYLKRLEIQASLANSAGNYGNEGRGLTQPKTELKRTPTGEPDKPKRAGGGARTAADDAARLIAQLNEQIALKKFDAESTEQQTAAEQQRAKVLYQLNAETLKASPEQRAKITGALDKLVELEETIKKQKEYTSALDKQDAANVKANQSMLEQIATAEKSAELYGLNAAQINAVTQSRLEEAIALARLNGAMPEHIAFMEAELELQKQLGSALEKNDLAGLLAQTETARKAKTEAQVALLDRALASGDIGEKQYREAIAALKGSVDDLDEFTKSAAKNMQSAFADFLFDPFAEGADKMAQKFGQTVQRMIAEAASAQLMELLVGDYASNKKTGDSGLLGGLFKAASSFDWADLFGFADGGIMTSAGPLPLHKYANGGIANSPQLAMFGEGRTPEAFVPLPDGRRIPVNLQGGGGGHTINQTLIFQGSADPAQVKRAAAAGYRSAAGAMATAGRYA